ncbi:myomegalin isoform X14 [Danio rerio]|uniref:Myomegalin isoform X14 n=1 Tax=Danio rerio TaxID=7955 RepID=A0AC58I3B3_DANRE
MMKCRVCAGDLCGTHRRWIFHPSAKLSLRVLLSCALGFPLLRDGRCEFTCSKCSFMLERMFRFDTVIARVQALSLERLQRLLLEKERLRQCISALYSKNNPQMEPPPLLPPHAEYCALLEEDLQYRMQEYWAEDEGQCAHSPLCHVSERRCRTCRALRVPDSDFEAVCKVPRRVLRSVSCGPSTRSASGCREERVSGAVPTLRPESSSSDGEQTLRERQSAGGSLESLDAPFTEGRSGATSVEPLPHAGLLLALQDCGYRPVRSARGSRLPILTAAGLTNAGVQPERRSRSEEPELQELEELWRPLLDEYRPLCPRRTPKEKRSARSLVEQQYEDAAGQCVSEQQVETLQTQITHSQNSNQELQQKLCELESELLSIRQTSQEQENTIQTLTHTLSTKDTQTQELYNVIEGQNKTLCKLRESQRLQPTQAPADAPDPVLQGSAVSCDLEETRCALTLTQRRLQDLQRERERLQTELQNTLQHRESAHTHTQDLRQAVEQLRSELQVKVCELRDREVQAQTHIADRDRTIAQLQQSLSRKDKQLQEYSELLNPSSDSSGVVDRDTLLQTLRRRIRERDRALESSIDERFRCVEQQEAEVRRLQLVLREKDRDLERLSSVLQSNNHTLTGLDAVLRSKDLELQGALEACRRLEFLKQQSEEKHTLAVRERDGIIKRLQTALHTHTTHTEELQVAGGQGSAGLLLKLSEAERLLQEVMSERSRQLQEHQRQISDLLEALSCRDQELQAYGERMGRLISERSDQLQDLRSLLNTHQQQLNTAHRERDTHTAQLKEKDTLIQELLQVQRHTLIPTAAADGVCMSSSTDLEIQTVRDELQLSLRKHRETERELSDLRALLPAGHHDTVSFNQQQLVSQQQKLNEVLRAEEDLQQSHSDSSSHHSGVQEECVLRARGTLLMLEPDDTGESSSDEDDGDGDDEDLGSSSEEFSDSIEDEEKLTQKVEVGQPGYEMLLSQNAEEIQCDEEQRRGVELCGAMVQKDEALSHTRSADEECMASAAHEEGSVRCRGSEKAEADQQTCHEPQRDYCTFREEEYEEDEDDEDEGEEAAEIRAPPGKRGPPCVKLRESRRKRRCTRPHSLDLGALLSHTPAARGQGVEMEREVEGDSGSSSTGGGGAIGFWQHVEVGLREQAERLRGDLAVSRQENRELQERLMVSEATVHAQAEQIKDYRELLTESAVQQDSKQVQVDLQDLGYETSGRSENEAEREDTSSPEFDDLEMCVTLSGSRRSVCRSDSEADDASSLKGLVQDLRAQLSRSHKVIRGLQLRVRSLSATSDYASSLERTPRKVNWMCVSARAGEGFECVCEPPLRRSREMQELLSRVELLETQIRRPKMEDKMEESCAPRPGKYNTLIQAQARELCHLRQVMREGGSLCHTLTQHLSDATKAFEQLLRANDIDYYTSQSFRQQLSQSSTLAHRVCSRISGRDGPEQQDDKTGHELLALRLSKELQHKDDIIQSLHTQLQQRPDTPCSSHAHSETTDQSECTSFLSDERGSTNEDADLCSDVDASSECVEDERRPDRVFSTPHSLSGCQLTAHTQSRIQPIRGVDGSSCYQSGVDVIEEHLREIRSLRQRLEDSIRTNERLRQQLEARLTPAARDTVAPTNIFIQSPDAVSRLSTEVRTLKEEQLELQARLRASRDSCEEAEQLREAVLSGRVRLQQAELEAEQWKEELRRLQTHNSEQSQQIQQLRQDRHNNQEHNSRLQHKVSSLQQQLAESRSLLRSLQSELQLYERVCGVRTSSAAGLVCELQGPSGDWSELLLEVRALRAQLENSALRTHMQKQLEQCSEPRPSPTIPASPLYRRQLLHDPSPSPPVRDVGPFPSGPLYSPYSEMEESVLNTHDALEPHTELHGDAVDGCYANANGRHAVAHVQDYSALQQQLTEGRAAAQRVEETLRRVLGYTVLHTLLPDTHTLHTLLADTHTLQQVLDEAVSLLKMFWRAALPNTDGHTHLLQRELQALRLRVQEQEELLQGTVQRLRNTSRSKENMENYILSQLSRTRDVLKQARVNLEVKSSPVAPQVLLLGLA